MGLEDIAGTGKYISDLDKDWPVGSDPKSQGDDHLRGIKNVLQNTFSALTGEVTATQDELNLVDGLTATTAELNLMDGVTATTTQINELTVLTTTVGMMTGDASQKMWVYRNSAMTGWLIDSSVSDKVIALKGASGSTYETAGATAGSWTISGLSNGSHTHSVTGAHVHQWHGRSADTSDAYSFNSGGGSTNLVRSSFARGQIQLQMPATSSADYGLLGSFYTSSSGGSSTTGSTTSSASQNGSWRTAAAVGTMQYLDL